MLKQAPQARFHRLSSFLLTAGLRGKPFIYRHLTSNIYGIIYVNDILVAETDMDAILIY